MHLWIAVIFLVFTSFAASAGGSPPIAATIVPMANNTQTTPVQPEKTVTKPLIEAKAALKTPQTTPPPQTYKASYSASYNGLPIKTQRNLRRISGNEQLKQTQYQLSTHAKHFLGSIEEQETFVVSKDGSIQPHHYEYNRNILGKKRREKTLFNTATNKVSNHYKNKQIDFPLTQGLLAPLSYQLQLRNDLLAGKKEFRYEVVYRSAIRHYHYRVHHHESLATPLGEIDTVVVQRIRKNSDRETFLWLAPSLDYLPVKLLQKEDDGDSHEMLINSYTVLNEDTANDSSAKRLQTLSPTS